jgi:uncharacterized protein (TIGR03066 family)
VKILGATTFFLVLAVFAPQVRSDEATDRAREMLLGKWEVTTGKIRGVIEFGKDGEVMLSFGTQKVTGTFKLLDAATLEVEAKIMGEVRKEKMDFIVSKDELVTTDANGRVEKYRRVK